MFSTIHRSPLSGSARWWPDGAATRSFPTGRLLYLTMALFIGLALAAWPVQARYCPPQDRGLSPAVPTLEDMFNPNPSKADIELPMPCGGKLILRHVCVPASGYFGDLQVDLGCKDCGRPNQGFMEGKRKAALSGPFTLQDLPEPWRIKLTELAKMGDGRCPSPNDMTTTGFYYFIGKYEISNFQWKAIMEGRCLGSDTPFTAEDPRPKTEISWFGAVDFTRRYTEWLLKNRPESLPKFSAGRFGYLRLPTEAEWEYAARGGHLVTESQMNREEFFPLHGRTHGEYAVFTEPEAAKPPEKLAWIGSRCSNPLGLFDTAGNAAEMVMDPFRFSVGSRLHGTTGGFVVKGGSYRKGKVEIMPGRREEVPFFLEDGAFRSTDLGFRIVLSAIVTPEDRKEVLDHEWVKAGIKSRYSQPGPRPSGLMVEIEQGKDPISEIDRLLAASSDEMEKKNLYFLRKVIQRKSNLLAEQKAETVKGMIQGALFAAESVTNYAMWRKVMLNELNRLKRIRTETITQSVLKALDGGIANTLETIRIIDAAIDNFVQFYIKSIIESQKYSDDILESQMGFIYQELSRDNGFTQSLKKRLDVFKKHVALNKGRVGGIDQEIVIKDIIPEIVR